MRVGLIFLAAMLLLGLAAPTFAQFKEGNKDTGGDSSKDTGKDEGKESSGREGAGTSLGQEQITRWRVGMVIKASGGACLGMTGYFAVPTDWPEQDVTIQEEDVSSGIKIRYQNVDGGAKIMSIQIPHLAAGDEAKALVTFEIHRSTILPPKDTDVYVVPEKNKLPANIRFYLNPSPKIECRDPKIREQAKELVADKENAWAKVESIYDWTRDKVKYKIGAPLKGAIASIKDGEADCEGMTSLFIALCRAADIPARTVWVEGHCYPEFYLTDGQSKGHWFPCQVAGSREFGGIIETKPILQKGDNFKPPKSGRERQRYIAEYVTGSHARGSVDPQVRFVREKVAK